MRLRATNTAEFFSKSISKNLHADHGWSLEKEIDDQTFDAYTELPDKPGYTLPAKFFVNLRHYSMMELSFLRAIAPPPLSLC
jgi:hypothetical protein